MSGRRNRVGDGWEEKRVCQPDVLRRDDLFTDVTLIAGGAEFRAHRVILASHSDYFLHLFTSGMREMSSGRITFHEVEADVFGHILDYVYSGAVSEAASASFDVLRDVLITANMWQIADLETAILRHLVAVCSPEKCLKTFLFFNSSAGLFKDTMPDGARESVEKVLVETLRDRWQILVSGSPAANTEDDDRGNYSATLNDLDLESLKLILSIKSEQEEVSDFSFSFNQSDICLAVISWIRHGGAVAERYPLLDEQLCHLFCLHQLSSNASTALTALHDHDDGSSGNPGTGERITPLKMLDLSKCRGVWCPQRRIPGLLIAHAWSPHTSNRITCDHIFFYFTIPKAMTETAGQARPLHTDFFYDAGQFGELGDGEKHILAPSACVDLGSDDDSGQSHAGHMILTVDGGRLSGTVVDPVGLNHKCRRRHVPGYKFCPSDIGECACEFDQTTICSDKTSGKIYVTACPRCHNPATKDKSSSSSEDDGGGEESCDTFRLVSVSDVNRYSGRVSFFHPLDGSVVTFGGFVITTNDKDCVGGGIFSYVHCCFDLQEFYIDAKTDEDDGMKYKAGHSHLKTGLGSLMDTPWPNTRFLKTNLQGGESKDMTDILREDFYDVGIGDAATVVVADKLYCIGGFRVEYDADLKLFYQSPQVTCKVLDLRSNVWSDGPSLPSNPAASSGSGSPPLGLRPGFTRGTAYHRDGKIYFSGGACLRVNEERVSNQIYEYVPNTHVFQLVVQGDAASAADAKWLTVLDLSRFASKFRSDAYSVIAIFPADISLPRIKIQKNQAGAKFMVKYLNINFPLGSGSSGGGSGGGVRKVEFNPNKR